MAFMDKQTSFGTAIDLSQAAGTFNSNAALGTDSIDTGPLASGNEGLNLGASGGLFFYFRMTELLSTGSSPTMSIQLYSGATAFAVTNLHYDSGVRAASVWAAGKTLVIPLPWESGLQYLQFLTIQAIIAVATTTTGLASAGIVSGPGVMQDLAVNAVSY